MGSEKNNKSKFFIKAIKEMYNFYMLKVKKETWDKQSLFIQSFWTLYFFYYLVNEITIKINSILVCYPLAYWFFILTLPIGFYQ